MSFTKLSQIVAYVEPEMKDKIQEIKAANKSIRLTESVIINRALELAMPTLRKEFLSPTSFRKPIQGAPGRRHKAA